MELLILLFALLLDLAIGEPHRYIHPVVWMGKAIEWLEKLSPKKRGAGQFIYGILMTVLVVGVFTAGTFLLLAWLRGLNSIIYVAAGAYLMKSAFSFRELRKTALRTRDRLLDRKNDAVRGELRGLVSRDTSELTEEQMVSAAVESVSESSSDSFVAPLLYFVVLGMPGAVAYRAINTLDSMIGYHGKYEYLGKFAARLDDIVNFIPARIAALLIIAAGWLNGYGMKRAWRTAVTDHKKTESPNAGWPMAAAAGALNVKLEKKEHYALGRDNKPLKPETITGALRLFQTAAIIWTIICFGAGGIYLATQA